MSLTEAEATAAAAVADAIMGDYAKAGGDVAAAAAPAPVEQPAVAAPEPAVPSSQPPAAQPAAETEPAPEADEVPSFEPDVPDDLRALLDEPDFDEEAAAEVAARVEANPDEYIDIEQTQTDLAKDKRIAFLEAQLVAKSRKNWVAENLRAYPLLRTYAKDEVEAFKATSRRGFAREAAALNARLETIAKPMLADIAKLKAETRAAALADGKQEAKNRWGNAPGDVEGTAPSAEQAQRLTAAEERARQTGSMKDVFKTMLETTPVV